MGAVDADALFEPGDVDALLLQGARLLPAEALRRLLARVAPAGVVQNYLDIYQTPSLRLHAADAATTPRGMASTSLGFNGTAATADATDPRP